MLTSVGAVIGPIREGIVSTNTILVVTSRDSGAIRNNLRSTHSVIGYDAEPYNMATVPEDVIVQDITNSLATISRFEYPQNLWSILEGNPPRATPLGPWSQPSRDYFVAALPNGTDTGVLRHRLMRFNSSWIGEEIDRSEFQMSCGGDGFKTNFVKAGLLEVRLCVPGRRGTLPWSNSRNRQDISEEVLIDVVNLGLRSRNADLDFTRRFTMRTTRGYFEMGNYRNNYIHGPLLERWDEPDPYATTSEYVL